MKKAIHVATGIQGLTFSIGSDGVWMNTSGGEKHTCVNLSNQAKECKNKTLDGLMNWCVEIDAKYRGNQKVSRWHDRLTTPHNKERHRMNESQPCVQSDVCIDFRPDETPSARTEDQQRVKELEALLQQAVIVATRFREDIESTKIDNRLQRRLNMRLTALVERLEKEKEMKFSKQLKLARIRSSLRQVAIARILNVSENKVSRLETGRDVPQKEQGQRMLEAIRQAGGAQ